jgi:hypothetical protein
MSPLEEVPRGEGFEEWALEEFVRVGSVIRAVQERLEEALQIADDRLEEIIGVRATLAGGKAIKLVNRNRFGEIVSVEEFTPEPRHEVSGEGAHRTGTGTASAGALRVTGLAGQTDAATGRTKDRV